MFCNETQDQGQYAFFNPEITKSITRNRLTERRMFIVSRYIPYDKTCKVIEMKYQDSEGEEHSDHLDGLGARCAQHED